MTVIMRPQGNFSENWGGPPYNPPYGRYDYTLINSDVTQPIAPMSILTNEDGITTPYDDSSFFGSTSGTITGSNSLYTQKYYLGNFRNSFGSFDSATLSTFKLWLFGRCTYYAGNPFYFRPIYAQIWTQDENGNVVNSTGTISINKTKYDTNKGQGDWQLYEFNANALVGGFPEFNINPNQNLFILFSLFSNGDLINGENLSGSGYGSNFASFSNIYVEFAPNIAYVPVNIIYNSQLNLTLTSNNLLKCTRKYFSEGIISMVELDKKLSSAIVVFNLPYEPEVDPIKTSGEAVCNYTQNIKINCSWRTSLLQSIRRNFSWDTGQLIKYYYRIVSQCLTGCPPYDISTDDCSVQVTSIIEASSITDLCEKFSSRVNFPILKVEKLSKPSHTADVQSQLSQGITNECTVFEPIDICTNAACVELCLLLDATIIGLCSTEVIPVALLKFTSSGKILVSGESDCDLQFEDNENFVHISNGGIEVAGYIDQDTSGTYAYSFRQYTSIGIIDIDSDYKYSCNNYNFIGGIDRYYVDIWPSQVSEVITDSNQNNWYYKNIFADYPLYGLPQNQGFFATDQNTSTNPNIGFILKSYVGAHPETPYLYFSNFRPIGVFPPTYDSYLKDPMGGDTFGTYDLNDLTKIGKLNEIPDNDLFDILDVDVFIRRTSINSPVIDNAIYLKNNDEFIPANLSSSQWSVSNYPILNFEIKKYQFNVESYSIDPNEFGFVIQSKYLSGLNNYAGIHYLFLRVLYQNKINQIARTGGSALVQFDRYNYSAFSQISMSGTYDSSVKFNYKPSGKQIYISSSNNISLPGYSASGGISIDGNPDYTSNAVFYTSDGSSIILDSLNSIESINFNYQLIGNFYLNSNNRIKTKYNYTSTNTFVDVDGFIKIDREYVSSGIMSVDGTYLLTSSSYETNMSGSIEILGASIYSSSFLGEFNVVAEVTTEMFDVEFFSTETDLDTIATATVPNSVLTKCNCNDLPLSLRFSQNLNTKGNRLFSFLNKNNLTMPTKNYLYYSKTTNSWQSNFHFYGTSLIRSGVDEYWDVLFDFSCTDIVGGTSLGTNFWKFSINVVQSNQYESFNSRIIVSFPPDSSCFYNNDLKFSMNIDTKFNFITIDPDLLVSQFVISDSIGLFKTKEWQNNPSLYIKISQGRLDRTIATQDLTSFV